MNLPQIKSVSNDLIQYGSVSELVAKTQEAKTQMLKEANRIVRLNVDGVAVSLIIGISNRLKNERGVEIANEYLSRTKGMVVDPEELLANHILAYKVEDEVIEAEVLDDPRVKELEAQLEQLQSKLDEQYTSSVANKAVLERDLERAKEVIKKLETDEDLTQAIKETAKLKQKLKSVKGEAEQAKTLRSELSAKDEAIANARTLEHNLKAQIQKAKDEVRVAKTEAEQNRDDAKLSYVEKQKAKSANYVAVAKKVRDSFILNDYLTQNGMVNSEIILAQSIPSTKHYDTDDMLAIARLIYTQRNEVSDASLLDKIEALISDALLVVEQAEVREHYNTLYKQYERIVKVMTDESLEE